MSELNGVQIAAAGQSTRIRSLLSELGYPLDYPKHLLPTGGPNGETFLGRIVRQALDAPGDELVTIHANNNNAPLFSAHPDIAAPTEVVVGNHPNFMIPFINKLAETKQRTLGCAGDFYSDFTWQEMLDHHDSNPFPITFMAGHTVEVDGGHALDIGDDGRIERMTRLERTSGDDLINIGVYIFDPAEAVLKLLENLAANRQLEKEVVIADALIEAGMVGSYVAPGTPFNVNTPATYKMLLEHTQVPLRT